MRRLSKLDKDIDRLQYFPEIGKVLATNHLTGSKLRLIVSGKTLIMFVVNKERAEISIEFIYNKGFDYKTIVDKYL